MNTNTRLLTVIFIFIGVPEKITVGKIFPVSLLLL